LPGSTGWVESDLDDPAHLCAWEEDRLEMLEGVLIQMPAATFDHGEPIAELLYIVREHLRLGGSLARVSFEVDIVLADDTVLKADGVLLHPADIEKQMQLVRDEERDESEIGRVRIPPTLVIESVSPGHERHDYVVKRRRFAEFGVPNYWIVNRTDRSLLCLCLEGSAFVEDVRAQGDQPLRPAAFPGLVIDLKDVFRSTGASD
jgi:Uma2 family endonuclease